MYAIHFSINEQFETRPVICNDIKMMSLLFKRMRTQYDGHYHINTGNVN